MKTLPLISAAEMCGGRLMNGDLEVNICGVSTDSRTVQPGNIFIALSGPSFDGHAFLADVHRKGAAAAVIEAGRSASVPPGLPCIIVANTRQALGKMAAAYRRLFRFP